MNLKNININIHSLLDTDWTKKPAIFILVFSFILSRIPLLNLGFGSDPDAWRIANSAFDLYYFHIYHPSRFPGYPLPEFFNSLIINYGWLATNIATMFISLVSVIVFAKILKELDIKNKGLLVITYAFLPILWINSASTMDYMWALTFILLTWFFIIKKQYCIAGLMMGLAIGSRITSAVLILPFLYLILTMGKNVKNIVYYLIMAVIMALILFLSLFLQYNLAFLTYYPINSDIITIMVTSIKYAAYDFGILAVVFGIMLFIINFKSLWDDISKKNNFTIFLVLSIIMVLILFIKAPYETAYLIPAIPFLLILISKISKKNLFAVLCVLLMLNSFVSFVSLDNSNLVGEGVVINDITFRTDMINTTQTILNSDIKNSVIISGEYLPILCYLCEKSVKNPKLNGMLGFNGLETKEHWDFEKNVEYIYLAAPDKIIYLHKKNYKIYYIGNDVLSMTENIYKYNLSNYNCSNIFID